MSELRADTITASDGTSPVTLTKQNAPKHLFAYDPVNATVLGFTLNSSSTTDSAAGQFRSNLTNAFGSVDNKITITNAFDEFNDGVLNGVAAVRGGAAITGENGSVARSASIISASYGYGAAASANGGRTDMSACYMSSQGDLA
jgi:hypothetical protein